jgi:hypothetical protein
VIPGGRFKQMTINFANDFSQRDILLIFHYEKYRDFSRKFGGNIDKLIAKNLILI